MRQPKGSLYLICALILFFAASLVLPLMKERSPIEFGLDLSGGVVVIYRPDFETRLQGYADVPEEELLSLAKETITSRLSRNLSTVPDVVVRGDRTLSVSIPSDGEAKKILELIGKTYHLTLRLVLQEYDRETDGPELFAYGGRYLELEAARFSGEMFDERSIKVESSPSSSLDLTALQPKVAFRFAPPHDEAFGEFTRAHVGHKLAILLDDHVEWVGTIESEITGVGTLAGSYNLDEATSLALMLKSGTLPMSLKVASLQSVGPSLGQEMKELGLSALLASVLGLALLIVIAYLKRRAFLLTGLLSLGCLFLFIAGMASLFGLTLDLVGIAGIVLSVGMGMDAFILVFESLEAKSRGLTAGQKAAHHDRLARRIYSFAGEGRTLFHANATTLLVILLLLTTERLKSFALFIFVGIFASVLTIFIARAILKRTYGVLGDAGPDLLAWLRRFRPRIFRWRKLYFAGVLGGLLALGVVFAGGASLELGGDFKSGTQIRVTSPEEAPLEAALGKIKEEHPGIAIKQQNLGESELGRYLITLSAPIETELGRGQGGERGAGERRTLDAGALAGIFEAEGVKLEDLESIDNRVSSARLARSLSVLLLSFFLLAVYFVAFQDPINRFFSARAGSTGSSALRWRIFFGILLAVVLDLALIVMTLVFLRIPLSLPVVAAVLTIIGYSVNDSVVLFSHVQSRWTEEEGKTLAPLELVTRGVDRILSRTVLTSLSTMMPALVILAVGLDPLRDFAWVMIAGTLAGTLSSIFVVGSATASAFERERRSRVRPVARSEHGLRPELS